MKKEVFIEKARSVHGDKYDYSLVPDEFLTKSKVEILCDKHGSFFQTATDHTQGYGCKFCGIESSRSAKIKDTEFFIAKAISVHGNMYDYSLVEYKTTRAEVKIICKSHGIFEQQPNSHLNGRGCPECAKIKISKVKNKGKKAFEQDAMSIHGYKYKYVGAYINGRTPTEILCCVHGVFRQSPENHLAGQGCPSCSVYGYSPELPCYFYVNKLGDEFLKFGITRNLDIRLKQQSILCNYTTENIFSIYFDRSDTAFSLEKSVKSNIDCGVISKEDMLDGYTETAKLADLTKIYDIILNFFTNNTS